jgi:hypothetical protein
MTSEAQMSQPTPIGGNVVTSVVRQYILPKVVDNVFQSNVVFFRINQSKRFIKGGTQIEVPIMYGRFSNGGAYRGFQVLDMSPNDTVRTAAYEWKQYYVPVSVDGRTLLITDSADAIVDYVKLSMRQAEMEMADNLGHDLFGTSVGGDVLDGLGAMIDQSNPSGGNYGGLDRTSTPLAFWKGGEDFTTSTMSLGALNDGFQAASEGGRHPSIILSRKDQYSRYWRLAVTDQVTMQGPVGYDEQLYSAGFTNLLFNGIPWVIDSHVNDGPNSTNSCIYMLNEDFIYWAVSPRADFKVEDFQTPIDQDAMASKMLFAGNLLGSAPARQYKFSNISS